MVNQVTVHLKWCNLVVCRVKDRKTLEVSHEDEDRWLQADKSFQIQITKQRFTKKIKVIIRVQQAAEFK